MNVFTVSCLLVKILRRFSDILRNRVNTGLQLLKKNKKKGCIFCTLSECLISILKTVKDLVARSNLLPKARNTAGLLTASKHGSQLPSAGELQHQGELPDLPDLLSQLLYCKKSRYTVCYQNIAPFCNK